LVCSSSSARRAAYSLASIHSFKRNGLALAVRVT
jgi:hypothetical protein